MLARVFFFLAVVASAGVAVFNPDTLAPVVRAAMHGTGFAALMLVLTLGALATTLLYALGYGSRTTASPMPTMPAA